MFVVEPSGYVPTAINCWVAPTAKLAHENRTMLIADTVGADVVVGVIDVAESTGKLTAGLLTPNRTALILAVPTTTPVALPVESIVTVPVVSMTQATRAVISPVEPSEYVPVAVNCWVAPIAKLAGEADSTSKATNVGADAVATVVKLTIGLVMPDRVALILTVSRRNAGGLAGSVDRSRLGISAGPRHLRSNVHRCAVWICPDRRKLLG